ncbi:PPOX class F420-dependent oxidoreductase [Streptomyces polygonati]|uniref:PPOX class F420-dependent oxidoreductase n=1 Tax=Streptomyces polygonati TaxID=1617087 RepID=A0ABV8HLI4_9ACTN
MPSQSSAHPRGRSSAHARSRPPVRRAPTRPGRPTGGPRRADLWEEDGRVLLTMDERRKRLEHLRDDPRVTLTVLDEADWYTHISIIGRVTEIREDVDLVDSDRLSLHYRGRPYAQRDRRRISARIEVDRWHGWGTLKDSSQPS